MIFGHEKQINFLSNLIKERKIPHALLFYGPEKIGKKTVAFEFAKLILKKEPFLHPDFIFIEPKEGTISISEIRDLIWKLSLKPFLAEYKIVIIDDAHSMAYDAQNCFLKKLEEPENSIIILITPYPNLLLPTIISRCQRIKFYPFSKQKIERFLVEKGIDQNLAKEIAKISQGKIGQAIELTEPKKFKEIKERMNDFKKIMLNPLYVRFNYVKELVENGKEKEILRIWLYLLREKLLEDLKNQKEVGNLVRKIAIFEKINYLLLTKNINKRLALEMLMLEI